MPAVRSIFTYTLICIFLNKILLTLEPETYITVSLVSIYVPARTLTILKKKTPNKMSEFVHDGTECMTVPCLATIVFKCKINFISVFAF